MACAAYIGLLRNSAGQFTSWVDDTPFGGSFYTSWNTGEPNNVAGGIEKLRRKAQGNGTIFSM